MCAGVPMLTEQEVKYRMQLKASLERVENRALQAPVGDSGCVPLTAPFEARSLRRVLGSFVTGVTVVTTCDAVGARYGLTVNSFSSVSLDPPLILWSQSLTSPSHPVFRDAPWFTVHILSQEQLELSRRFATGGADKFAGLEVSEGLGGVPVIAGCTATLECSLESRYPGGDHQVFIGRVHRLRHCSAQPLVFGGGNYLATRPFGETQPPGSTRC